MGRLELVAGGVVLLLVLALAPQASAASVDGFVTGDPPLHLDGTISGRALDPALHLTNPNLGVPDRPMTIWFDELVVTQRTYDTEVVHTTAPVVNYSVSYAPPNEGVDEEIYTFENVTLEISAVGRDADLLLSADQAGGLAVAFNEIDGQARAATNATGLTIQDGYQKNVGEQRGGMPNAFLYEYNLSGPVVSLEELQAFKLSGPAQGYIWDAHVQIRNETGELASFNTGYHAEEDMTNSRRSEHYEYVLLDGEGVETELLPGGLSSSLVAPALGVDLDGTATVRDATGSFQAGDDLFKADGGSTARLEGNLSMDITPTERPASSAKGDDPRLTLSLAGDLTDVSLEPVAKDPLIPGGAMAVTAGGATLLGLAAAWYVFGVKGASVGAVLARPRREEEETTDVASSEPSSGDVAVVDLDRPGDLLFDPDRFTLYHLIASQTGLTAEEARRETGIEHAEEALELLADHGLLAPMTEDPRRYCLPGQVTETQAQQIAFLHQDHALQVAKVLAMHGLMPEERLLERVTKAHDGIPRYKARQLLNGLVRHNLAIREHGEDGPVIDPAQALYECLELVGQPVLHA